MAKPKGENKEAADQKATGQQETAEQKAQREINEAIAKAIAEHEAGKLATAIVPTQGALFAAERFVQPVKAWQGKVLDRDAKDSKGNVLVNEKGEVVKEQYGVRIAPLNAKEAAEKLGLKGKENKELLASARLAESDQLLNGAKGTIAALDANWTLANFTVKRNRKGQNELVMKAKEVKRTPEREKYARALGMTIDPEGQWAIELDNLIASQRAKMAAKAEKPPIDV